MAENEDKKPRNAPAKPDAVSVCEQTLAKIHEKNLPPTPENYAIWYHATSAMNPMLNKEISAMERNNLPFSNQTTDFLYKRFIATDKTSEATQNTANNANKLLNEVLQLVKSFSNDTKDYNEGVDKYVEKLDVASEDPSIKNLIKDIIDATVQIRQQGSQLSEKLDQSEQEIVKLKKDLEQITEESQRDALTGISNRKNYDRILADLITSTKKSKTELCVLMIDVDHFKSFNDRYGHLIGDEVLKIVAKSLTDSIRGKDVAARYGGEEFSVILPDTPVYGAMKVAETIRKTIASRELKRRDSGESYGTITVSVGVSIFRHETDDSESLIKRADDALYVSKRRGRNRVTQEGQTIGE